MQFISEPLKKKKLPNIELTELIIIKCGNDWSSTYMGTIIREKDKYGNPVARGTAVIDEGKVWSMASTEEELENNLDDICWLKNEMGIHNSPGATSSICETDFYLN